ncbi:MAG: hypothetical protein WEF50_17865 [Myxococcota bacterium]
MSFRLRVAQSHMRHDLTPSHWSHVGLLTNGVASETVVEVPLDPEQGFDFPTPRNGRQDTPLRRFRSAAEFPNIAVFSLPLGADDVRAAVDRFEKTRPTLDALRFVLQWLGFLWGVSGAGNPLHENVGIPSAIMLEFVTASLRFDLTPGLETRASCPEAIWQSAKWWEGYYTRSREVRLTGSYTLQHVIDWPVRGRRPRQPD